MNINNESFMAERMKTTKRQRLIVSSIGALLFNCFFWKETIGINLFLITLYLIGAICLIHPGFRKSGPAVTTATGMVLMSIIACVYNSEFSIWMYFISGIALAGFLVENEICTLIFSIPSAIMNYLVVPKSLLAHIEIGQKQSQQMRLLWRFVHISTVPLVFLYIFYLLFSFSNPVFNAYATATISRINDVLSLFFEKISFERFFFFLLGFWIFGGILLNREICLLGGIESGMKIDIYRKRNDRAKNDGSMRLKKPVVRLYLGLQNEYRAAFVLMVLVNMLLLVVNIIDINWLWFNFHYTKDLDLRQFVHEGTYLLILSIILSIGIMLHYFRENLNFHPCKTRLQWLAYIWIVQNAILTISVALRNFHYRTWFGLAYKRIGVLIFLALVLFGLICLIIKIKQAKSSYFLFKNNAWAAYAILIAVNFVDWEIVIARLNLEHSLKDNIETSFLLTLSDTTLPLIEEHQYILDQSTELNTYISFYPISYRQVFNNRVCNFLKRKENTSWLSWNYAEYKAYDHLKKHNQTNGK